MSNHIAPMQLSFGGRKLSDVGVTMLAEVLLAAMPMQKRLKRGEPLCRNSLHGGGGNTVTLRRGGDLWHGFRGQSMMQQQIAFKSHSCYVCDCPCVDVDFNGGHARTEMA